jgi:hypothetical protein
MPLQKCRSYKNQVSNYVMCECTHPLVKVINALATCTWKQYHLLSYLVEAPQI